MDTLSDSKIHSFAVPWSWKPGLQSREGCQHKVKEETSSAQGSAGKPRQIWVLPVWATLIQHSSNEELTTLNAELEGTVPVVKCAAKGTLLLQTLFDELDQWLGFLVQFEAAVHDSGSLK